VLGLLEVGGGPDLVLLEAGLGAGAASWGAVLDALGDAGRADAPHGPGTGLRVLAHDRAGIGRSGAATGPRDLAALADDLLEIVAAIPHERLVLAGHSWGGPIARTAAARLLAAGERVDGLVLVDPAEELADLYFTPAARAMEAVQETLLPLLARARLLGPLQRPLARPLPERWREEAVAAIATPAAARAVREESRHVTRGLLGLRLDPPAPLGIPVAVITGRRPEGLGRRLRDQLTAAHRARADREGGSLVLAERSGHLIPLTEPGLVAREVLRLLS
jgi:pimeloyl-ACP methyl ester carboxylesterase